MAIKNYTSGVDVFTSLGEIQGALAGHGARQIMVEYAPQGNPIGWRITDLVIYDAPHELNSFRRVCPEDLDCESCAMHRENTGRCGNEALYLRRAPQSWCYVEEKQ